MGGDALMMGLSTGIQMAGSLASGSAAKSEAETQSMFYDLQALQQERQGDLLLEDAKLAAIQRAREVRKFQDRQSTLYAQSGITLQGTPIMVMEETRRLGQQEVDQLLKRGQALKNLQYNEAANTRITGQSVRERGRQALFGSVFDAVGKGVSAYTGYSRGTDQVYASDQITNITSY